MDADNIFSDRTDPLPTGPPRGDVKPIMTLMTRQLSGAPPYVDIAVVFGCECHGVDYRHWGRACYN